MTTDEMERPAKQYQIDAVNVQLTMVNEKLDQILEGQKAYVTHKEFLAYKKQIDEKYGPIYKLFWLFIAALLIEGGLIAFQFSKKG